MAGERLLAGAGKSAIEVGYPIEGFTGERDALHARVLALSAGSAGAAIVVVDLTSVPDDLVAELQDIVGCATVVTPKNVFVCASHTFSAPHIGPGFRDAVSDAVSRAAARAARNRRPARLGFGRGISRVNVNRDIRTADGWWLGANEQGVTDPSVAVVRIDDQRGHPLAILTNYAVQSSVMNESGGLVTADLAGAAVRYAEQQYGDETVVAFLTGAAGDQAPYLTASRHVLDKDGNWSRADAGGAGHLLVDLLGERLGTEIVRVSERITCDTTRARLRVVHAQVEVQAQRAPASFRDLRPVTSYDFEMAGTTVVPVAVMRVGDVALVGLQAELSSATGMDIKARSPFERTLVATMVNGGAKYMADSASYDKITYAAMNSRYAKGAAETVAAAVLRILKVML